MKSSRLLRVKENTDKVLNNKTYHALCDKLVTLVKGKQFLSTKVEDPVLGYHFKDLENVVNRGFKILPVKVNLLGMTNGECHFNALKLLSIGKIDKVFTGAAVSNDGIVSLHSWGQNKKVEVVETISHYFTNTKQYFGYELTKADLKEILSEDNYAQFSDLISFDEFGEFSDSILFQ